MSMFSKKTYQFAEVIALQENQSGWKNLFNKARLIGTIRRIRVGGNATVYEFAKANDKTQTATITGQMGNNPNADRDWDDNTYADIVLATGGTQDVRIYDYGTVKERFLYYKFSASIDAEGQSAIGRLYYSNDGQNWMELRGVSNGTVSGAALLTFRYLKFNITAAIEGARLGIYSLEVFDRDDYTKKTVCTNYAEHEISTLFEPVHIWLEGSLYSYYVYDLKLVKVTVSEGEVEI